MSLGSWLKKNVIANPLLNPVGAVINTIQQNKTISTQNTALNQASESIQYLSNQNTSQSQVITDYDNTLRKYQELLDRQMSAPAVSQPTVNQVPVNQVPVGSLPSSIESFVESSADDKTTLYVIIGVVAVTVLYFIFKKK